MESNRSIILLKNLALEIYDKTFDCDINAFKNYLMLEIGFTEEEFNEIFKNELGD